MEEAGAVLLAKLSTGEIRLPGWDLEREIRLAALKQLGRLAQVAALLDDDLKQKLEGDVTEPDEGEERRLLDRIGSTIRFDEIPWKLRGVELGAGGMTARGRGRFDPLDSTVDLQLTAELDRKATKKLVKKTPELRVLVGDGGRLSVPLRVKGDLLKPSVTVDLGQMLPGKGNLGDAAEDLIRGLIDKH